MRFSFSSDQKDLANGLREMLAGVCTAERVRSVWDAGTGHDPELWGQLAEMGVFSMLVPGAAGGMSGDEVDVVLMAEQLGWFAVPGPVLETMCVVAPLKPEVADGSVVATCAIDGSPYVAHAEVADVVLTADGWWQGFSCDPVESIDGGRHLAVVSGGTVTSEEIDLPLAQDRAALAAAAALLGVSGRMIDIAGDYARARHQFGQPIGAFQAVKHHMANALLQVEFARPAVYRAAFSVATDAPTRARDVSMAKALASEAGAATAKATLQVHGAIGYTWECDLQLFMKKAWALAGAHGGARYHRRRVADAVLGPRV